VSFILDALRKSEHERQRQSGPALAEVPVAAGKPRSNVWAPVAIALLLVNLVVVGVLMIRKSMRDPKASPPAAAIVERAPALAAQPLVATASPAPAPAPASPPAIAPPVLPAADAYDARNPLEAEAADGPPMLDPGMAAQAAAAPPGPPAVTRTPSSRGSVVYESLPDSATLGGPQYAPQPGTGRPATSSGAGLPPADELAGAGVAALNLDLHVYSTKPEERLVFINSHKYREGDTTQEGPAVRQITPGGVVLEYNGRSYLLTHD
jgi:general secretion pathway protein B